MADHFRTDGADLDWNDLRYVLALSRHGSLSAAARSLKVNHATVSRRVAALEAALGVSLFARHARGYRATAAAQPVIAAAEQVEAPLLQLGRQAGARQAEQVEGLVRLTATEGVATHAIAPALPALLRRWPKLQVEIVVEQRSLSLARREADIAFRWAQPQSGELYASRLGNVSYRLYRAASVADRSLVARYDEALSDLPESRWLADQSGLRPALSCNSMQPLLAAARAGACSILLPDYVGRQFPELQPEPGRVPVNRDLWLVLHRDLRRAPRVRAVSDHLATAIRTILRG
jgi:DNA-binding transcriptional LysR family regulator